MSGKKLSKRTWCKHAGLAVVSLLTILGAGCKDVSFGPMHAHTSLSGGGVAKKLRSVHVTTIPGRVGQRIRNEIIFQSSGGGNLDTPKYRLDITITERVTSTLVNIEGEPASKMYQLDATFQLLSVHDNKIILQGTSYGRAGFERFSSIFSNVRAREDAENRAAKTVAQDIRNQLGAALAST